MRCPQSFRSSYAVKTVCAAAIVLMACSMVLAKDFWETKPYDQWSQKDCEKLLNNSPWAKELNLVGANIDYGMGGGGASMDSQAPYIKYVVTLRSAAPIRQAIVRQMQIANKYESMSDEQKAAFAQQTQGVLNGFDPDLVVVHVTFDTNNRDYQQTLLRHWMTQTVDLLKNSVYLSGSKGEKVSLTQFVPVQGGVPEFMFAFPRKVDGKDVLLPSDKALRLEFTYPGQSSGLLGDGNAFIEFKADKMKLNGEVIY